MYYFLLYLLSVISELKNLLDTIAGTSMMLLIFYCVGLFVYWSIQHEKRSDDILDGIEVDDYINPFIKYKKYIYILIFSIVISNVLNMFIPTRNDIIKIAAGGYIMTNGADHIESLTNSVIGKKIFKLIDIDLDKQLDSVKSEANDIIKDNVENIKSEANDVIKENIDDIKSEAKDIIKENIDDIKSEAKDIIKDNVENIKS